MRRRALVTWVAGGVAVAAAVAWLALDRRTSREAFPEYSVFNTAPEGLSLAYAYLREREGAGDVSVLTRPVGREMLARDAVILRVRPTESVFPGRRREGKQEAGARKQDGWVGWLRSLLGSAGPERGDFLTPAETAFVEAGGRIVIAADRDYESLDVEPAPAGEVESVYPAFAGVESVAPPRPRSLAGAQAAGMHAVFAAGERPLVARARIGEGDVIVMTCPEVLANRRLGEADHLALLEALAGRALHRPTLVPEGPGAARRRDAPGRGRAVYFDEYVHGMASRVGALELLRGWGLGPLVVTGALAAAAAFWRARARIGPPEDDHRETRVEAVDFVDSLAELYGRALRRIEALALYEESFRHAAAVSTGLKGPALDERVRSLTKGLDVPTNLAEALRVSDRRVRDMAAQEFARCLGGLNSAFGRLEHAKRQ